MMFGKPHIQKMIASNGVVSQFSCKWLKAIDKYLKFEPSKFWQTTYLVVSVTQLMFCRMPDSKDNSNTSCNKFIYKVTTLI